MANLENAADELVRKLQAVDGEIETAHERFGTLKEQLATLDGQIENEWVEVAKQVAELVQTAQQERETVNREAQEAVQQTTTLESSVQGARDQAVSALDAAENAASALTDHIREHEPAIDQMAKAGAETPFDELSERADAVAGDLEKALDDARDFLESDVTAGLQTLATNIEERFSELRTTLVEECGGAIQTAFDDWSAKLDEVVSLVQQDGFDAAKAHVQEVVDWAMTECAKTHKDEFDKLIDVVDAVEQALDQIQTDIGESKTDVGEEGKNALDQALTETNDALVSMIGTLEVVKQLLASYTFVEM